MSLQALGHTVRLMPAAYVKNGYVVADGDRDKLTPNAEHWRSVASGLNGA